MTSPTTFTPTGYCRCGYATNPGICSECGRTNRRVRRWNPLGVAARRVRWTVRILATAAFLTGLFLAGRLILWNYWPLEQIHYLGAMHDSNWWSNWCRDLAEKIVDHRSRQMFDLAHERFRALRNLSLNAVYPTGVDAKYKDVTERSAFVHDGEFVIGFGPPFSLPPREVFSYGRIIQVSDAEIIVRVDWDWRMTRILPVQSRPQQTYVRALLNKTPVLVESTMLAQAWSFSRPHLRASFVASSQLPIGVFCPAHMAEGFLLAFQQRPLSIPPEYCDQVLRPNLAAYVTDIAPPTPRSGGMVWTERITLNIGAAHGVRPGLQIYPEDQRAMPFYVKQVDETTCVAENWIMGFGSMLVGNALLEPILPEVGMLVRTNAD